ncbi:trypsin-like serine protease [Kitasatospora purpeofusca]|uniref:trypsin-like serine protease n=1 Tax=Kitasatospora purpeofusca TaxID=67352 RepID=UPI0036D42E8C
MVATLLTACCFASNAVHPVSAFTSNPEKVTAADHPWFVTLKFKYFDINQGRNVTRSCSGAFTSVTRITTAGHCIREPGTKDVVFKDAVEIYLGAPKDKLAPQKVLIPGQLKAEFVANTYDIAVIIVPVDLFAGLKDILPVANAQDQNLPDARLYGSGRIAQNQPPADELYRIAVKTTPYVGASPPNIYGDLVDASGLAANPNGAACEGDSGGPLVAGGELHGVISEGYPECDSQAGDTTIVEMAANARAALTQN